MKKNEKKWKKPTITQTSCLVSTNWELVRTKVWLPLKRSVIKTKKANDFYIEVSQSTLVA